MPEPLHEIIAAVVDDEATASALTARLKDADFNIADIDHFDLNPAGQHHGLRMGGDQVIDAAARGGGVGALAGAGLGGTLGAALGLAVAPLFGLAAVVSGLAAGAYAGSLIGALNRMGRDGSNGESARPAGVMVAVNTVSAKRGAVAIDAMRLCGARFIERARGLWRGGKWIDFDPVAVPDVILLRKPDAHSFRHRAG